MPARRYSADDFVDAAMALLSRGGAATLTLKAVGQELGADTTAIYHYFPGKAALLSAMVDRVLAELVDSGQSNDDPRADLERIALGMRRIQRLYPLLAETISGTEIIAPNAIRLSRRVIDNLAALGLAGDTLVRTYQALENFVLGSNWNDGVGIPNSWEIRRERYAILARPGFSDRTADEIAALSDAAYMEGIGQILDAAVRTGSLRR